MEFRDNSVPAFGIQRTGLECYMNTAIQMLFSCPSIYKHLQNNPLPALQKVLEDLELMCMDCSGSIIHRCPDQPSRLITVDFTAFKQWISREMPKFQQNEMHSAVELFTDIVDKMECDDLIRLTYRREIIGNGPDSPSTIVGYVNTSLSYKENVPLATRIEGRTDEVVVKRSGVDTRCYETHVLTELPEIICVDSSTSDLQKPTEKTLFITASGSRAQYRMVTQVLNTGAHYEALVLRSDIAGEWKSTPGDYAMTQWNAHLKALYSHDDPDWYQKSFRVYRVNDSSVVQSDFDLSNSPNSRVIMSLYHKCSQ